MGREQSIHTLSGFLILGDGWVTRTCYLPATAECAPGRVRVFDTTPGAAGSAALEQALALARIRDDLVIVIATPNATHWSFSRAFLETRNHVLVEKPLSLPGEIAPDDPLLQDDVMRRLWVSAPYRHRSDVKQLGVLIAAGNIGSPRAVHASWRRQAGIPRPGSWYTSKRMAGGGALVDLGTHLLDVVLNLVGWPEVIVEDCTFTCVRDWKAGASRWMGGSAGEDLVPDVETGAKLSLTDRSGLEITIEVAWQAEVEEDMTTIEVIGDKGRLRLVTLFGFAPGRVCGTISGECAADIIVARKPALDFARMLRALGHEGAATGRQGLSVMDIIERAYSVGGSTISVPR